MESITLYQLYDDGSYVTMIFSATRNEQMFLSKTMNFSISELEQIMHWVDHSEVKVLSENSGEKDWFSLLMKERLSAFGKTC